MLFPHATPKIRDTARRTAYDREAVQQLPVPHLLRLASANALGGILLEIGDREQISPERPGRYTARSWVQVLRFRQELRVHSPWSSYDSFL